MNPTNRLAAVVAKAQSAFEQRGGTANGKKRERKSIRRQWTRQIVKTDRMDQIEWFGNQDEEHAWYTSTPIIGVRSDAEVDAAINDLFYGDTKNPEERPGYLNGPELLQDIFFTFFLANPKLHKKSEVIKDARLNGKFVEQMMELPAFEEIRDYTIADPETAKGAMLALVDVIKEMIKQHREAVQEANDQREQDGCDPSGPPGNSSNKESWDEETPGQRQQSSGDGGSGEDREGKSQYGESDSTDEPQDNWDHREEGGDDSAAGGESSPPDPGESSDNTDGGDNGNELLDDNERDFNDELDGDYEQETNWEKIAEGIDFGRYANAPLSKMADDLGDLQEAVKGIGVTSEEWKTMDPTRRMQLAKLLNNQRMKRIADMCGRMTRFKDAKQAQKVIDSPHEIYTIEQGNDLARTVRQEFALLGHADTKLHFYVKYANAELLQYKKRGHEDVGKGPMIVCVDNSGSMGGAPEEWAKGVTEALRRIASDQDRDFYVIYFETNHHRERFDFPKGKGPFEKIMAYLSVSAGGGTQFDGVLEEALQKAVDFHQGTDAHGKSDIIFITDGMANLDQAWIDRFNDKRREHQVRVFSIYISAYDSERSSAMRLLESFSDTAIPVKELAVDDQTTDRLFSTI